MTLPKSRRAGLLGVLLSCGTAAAAQDLPTVDVGVLAYGTAQWEMQVIEDHALDTAAGVDLVLRPLGSEQAGDVALLSGEVDVILTDFVWVSLQRAAGTPVTMVPHSRAVGGLMTRPGSGIDSLDDLPGARIGVAGGPVDKSWIILQAAYARRGGTPLSEVAEARFSAPPLVNELLADGRLDATLNFWHWNARARAAGMVEVVSVEQMLADLGVTDPAPLLGWAFFEETAEDRPEAIRGFLAASAEAKRLMATDDAVWDDLRETMDAPDDALFEGLRDAYRAGILADTGPATVAAAEATFAILAEQGGPDAVGGATSLAPGTFWTDAGE